MKFSDKNITRKKVWINYINCYWRSPIIKHGVLKINRILSLNELAQKLGIKTTSYKSIEPKEEYCYLRQVQTTFVGAQRRGVSQWEKYHKKE